MAKRLVHAGFDVVGWNRNHRRIGGVKSASSPAEAARGADFVVTMLADERALRAVAPGILSQLGRGAVWIETSTSGPTDRAAPRA